MRIFLFLIIVSVMVSSCTSYSNKIRKVADFSKSLDDHIQYSSTTSCDRAKIFIHVGKEKKNQCIIIQLRGDKAPCTVDNFKKLVRTHFYDSLLFYRIFPHLLMQTGDTSNRWGYTHCYGTVGIGYNLKPEIGLPHLKGAVVAAALPEEINPTHLSNGSQFYILLDNISQLDGQDTVFGYVIEGMDILDKVSQIPTDANNFPDEKIKIDHIELCQ